MQIREGGCTQSDAAMLRETAIDLSYLQSGLDQIPRGLAGEWKWVVELGRLVRPAVANNMFRG